MTDRYRGAAGNNGQVETLRMLGPALSDTNSVHTHICLIHKPSHSDLESPPSTRRPRRMSSRDRTGALQAITAMFQAPRMLGPTLSHTNSVLMHLCLLHKPSHSDLSSPPSS